MTPSKDIHEIVKESVQSIVNEFPTGDEYESGYKDGYQMGYSVAGNDYGSKWEQAKKVLEDIEALTKRPWSENSNIDIYLICRDILSSWKEEGKPEQGIKMVPLPEPVGTFVMKQKDVPYLQLQDGGYWHYKDVITLLQRYKNYNPEEGKGGE